jgi:hypothetical protein
MLHSPSDQFRLRFHKVTATLPNISVDFKFLNIRTIKKESRECVIPFLNRKSLKIKVLTEIATSITFNHTGKDPREQVMF